jgi:phosphomannomutase
MAKKEGFKFVDSLTGFKWIANQAIEMELQWYDFLFAYEVEIGFLVGNMGYDKYWVRTCGIFAE